jgi:hypothetical protein
LIGTLLFNLLYLIEAAVSVRRITGSNAFLAIMNPIIPEISIAIGTNIAIEINN